MSISVVQSATGSNGGVASASVTVTYSSNNTINNFLCLAVRGPGQIGQTITVTDTLGNNWVQGLTFNEGGTDIFQLWYVYGCKAGANTITISRVAGGNGFYRGVAAEFSGVTLSVGAIENSTSSTTTTLPDIATPFLIPAQPSDLLLGFFANSTADSVNPTSASDWTSVNSVDGNLALFYKLASAAPATSWQTSMVGAASQQYLANIAALSAATGQTVSFIRAIPFGQTAASSTTTTTTTALTAGDVAIVTITWNDATHTVSSVTDSAGNTWSPVANTLQHNASLQASGTSSQLYSAPITTGGGSVVITVTLNGASTFLSIFGAEFRGVATSNYIAASNSASGNAAPVSPVISPTGNVALYGTVNTNGASKPPTPPWILISNGSATDVFAAPMYQLINSGQIDFVGAMTQYVTAGAGLGIFPTVSQGNWSSAYRDFISKHGYDDDGPNRFHL